MPRIVAIGIPLAASLLAAGTSFAQSPTPPPTPIAYASPGPGGLTPGILAWEAVSPPRLREDRWLGSLATWDGGFALVEHKRTSDAYDYRPRAVWRSSDGRVWDRSPLPKRITDVSDLLAYRDGLLLVTNEPRDWRHFGFSLGFWRSPDGVRWRRAGELAYEVPERLERLNCQANAQQVTTIGDRIMVYVTMCWDPCCGALPIVSGDDTAVGLAARVRGPIGARGVTAWSSGDGRRWRRVALEGMAPPGTDDFGLLIRQQPDELLALREGRQPTVLRSADGVSWATFGQVPSSLDSESGTLEMVPLPDGVLLIGESWESPPGHGNEMIVWRMTPTDTTQVFARRAAVAEWVVVDGERFLVGGRSWGKGPNGVVDDGDEHDDDEAWAWVIGSADGGRTWPETSSWTGADQSCVEDVVRNGDTLVGLACVQDRGPRTEVPLRTPAIWLASTVGVLDGPGASSSPPAANPLP